MARSRLVSPAVYFGPFPSLTSSKCSPSSTIPLSLDADDDDASFVDGNALAGRCDADVNCSSGIVFYYSLALQPVE